MLVFNSESRKSLRIKQIPQQSYWGIRTARPSIRTGQFQSCYIQIVPHGLLSRDVEVGYNVMAHAQEKMFVYGRNGLVHIHTTPPRSRHQGGSALSSNNFK
jgi:hypothetical protein